MECLCRFQSRIQTLTSNSNLWKTVTMPYLSRMRYRTYATFNFLVESMQGGDIIIWALNEFLWLRSVQLALGSSTSLSEEPPMAFRSIWRKVGEFEKERLSPHSLFGRQRSPSHGERQQCQRKHFSFGRTGPGVMKYHLIFFCIYWDLLPSNYVFLYPLALFVKLNFQLLHHVPELGLRKYPFCHWPFFGPWRAPRCHLCIAFNVKWCLLSVHVHTW